MTNPQRTDIAKLFIVVVLMYVTNPKCSQTNNLIDDNVVLYFDHWRELSLEHPIPNIFHISLKTDYIKKVFSLEKLTEERDIYYLIISNAFLTFEIGTLSFNLSAKQSFFIFIDSLQLSC